MKTNWNQRNEKTKQKYKNKNKRQAETRIKVLQTWSLIVPAAFISFVWFASRTP